MRAIDRTTFYIFFFAFVLNFVWEALHSKLYYPNFGSYNYLVIYLIAPFVDALVILFLLKIAELFKNKIWQIVFIIFGGLFIAFLFEKIGLWLDLWQYKNTMPIMQLINIGFTPLIQLSATTLIIWFMLPSVKRYLSYFNSF